LQPSAERRYFSPMAMKASNLDQHPPRPALDAVADGRHSWMGLVGGAAVLMLAALAAAGLWHLAGSGTTELTINEQVEAESLLSQLGFPPGPVDGVIDEQSRNAIRDFQLTAGLNVDGRLDPGLLDELRTAKVELSD
jgi:hypothetical protein